MTALGHLKHHTSHPQGLPHGLAPPIQRRGKGGYRLRSAVRGLLPHCVGGASGHVSKGLCPQLLQDPPPPPRASRDTLKPKMLPCSCRSLFSRVLFPAPEGPLRTTGLGPDIPVRGGGRRKSQQGRAPCSKKVGMLLRMAVAAVPE